MKFMKITGITSGQNRYYPTMKYIQILSKCFLATVFLFSAVVLRSQDISIDVTVYDIHVSDSSIFFRYSIKNNSESYLWFHVDSGIFSLYATGDTIFFKPVSNYTTSWIVESPFNIKTIKIDPRGEISGYFDERRISDSNFITADYLNLDFVFTTLDVENPIPDRYYRFFLQKNMILVNRIFRIRE